MVDGVEEQHPHQAGVRHLRNEVSVGQKLRRLFIPGPIIERGELLRECPVSLPVQLDTLRYARERHLIA